MAIRPTLDNFRALGDFSQVFRWHVDFTTIPEGIAASSEDINFRAESMSKPNMASNATEIQVRGQKIVRPGIGVYSNELTLTMLETTDFKIHAMVKAWQGLCWESENGSTGKTQNYADLEGQCILTLLDNLDEAKWVYTLHGVWMKDPGGGDVDASTEDPHKPAISMAYDYFTHGPA